MSDEAKDKKPGMPWQWRLALARLLLAVGLGSAAFIYAAYLVITGDYGAALGVSFCLVVGVRLIGGALLDIDRK